MAARRRCCHDWRNRLPTQAKRVKSRRKLTHFTSGRIFGLALSRDGKRLAIARGAETSDVVLIRNFK